MRIILLLAGLFICLTCLAAGAAEPAREPAAQESIVGTYKGTLTLTNMHNIKDFSYTLEILKIDKETGKVWMHVASPYYKSGDITRKNCELVTGGSAAAITCMGEQWHEDYEVKGDVVKARGVSPRNFPYSISATRVKP